MGNGRRSMTRTKTVTFMKLTLINYVKKESTYQIACLASLSSFSHHMTLHTNVEQTFPHDSVDVILCVICITPKQKSLATVSMMMKSVMFIH